MAWASNQNYTGTPFSFNGSQYKIQTEANVSNNEVTSRKFTLKDSNGNAVATSTNASSWSAAPGVTLPQETQKALAPGGALNKQAVSAINQDAKKNGASSNQLTQLSQPNTTAANNPQNPDNQQSPAATDPQRELLKEENNTYREGTRTSYPDSLRYPKNLNLDHQDCIKFSILKYRPSLASVTQGGSASTNSSINRRVQLVDTNPTIQGSERLGTIILPIPSGITDSNSVDWQSDTLNDLQKAAGQIAERFIVGGAKESEGAVQNAAKTADAANKSGELQQLAAVFAGAAVGSDRLQQRAYGSIFNNNLELLFNSPTLRSAFTFNFKFSPRNEPEAVDVRKIIRAFKQAMAVKRSSNSILLKTPHTFAISYLTSNQEHPYLNKFKECALISCNVDYTPEGTYMTYKGSNPNDINARSMVSYNLSLTFQELEPIFDDDYGALDSNSDRFIGY